MKTPSNRSQVTEGHVTKESDMNTVAPYASSAHFYLGSGLGFPVPVKPAAKAPVLRKGATGRNAEEMMTHHVQEEVERNGSANIAIRMEEWMISIDVDNYKEKQGAATLAAAIAELGPLPPTYRSTRRLSNRVSGQFWYRVPHGLHWPSNLGAFGPDVEVIHSYHRYALVYPSVVEGEQYRWFNPEGELLEGEPDFFYMDFPELPQAWVDRLQASAGGAGEVSEEVQREFSDWTFGDTDSYVSMMVEGWEKNEDEVPNWHDWLFSSCCRLAAAHRLGLVSEDDLKHGRSVIRLRLKYATNRSSSESPESEFTRTWNDGLAKVERMTEEQAAEALGSAGAGAARAASGKQGAQKGPTTAQQAQMAAVGATDSGGPQIASWLPVDLSQFVNGSHKDKVPTLMAREDGVCLLYEGLVHSFHGESESGKSWVALIAATDLLCAGRKVTMLDYESTPSTVVNRLLRLGVPASALLAHFQYIRPESNPFKSEEELQAFISLLGTKPELVILDGVTEALVTHGAATKDNDDITDWIRNVPRRIAQKTKAAVVVVDHVVKDKESQGRFAIGGQAKMSALDGAAYTVEVKDVIGVGLRGAVVLRVGKDREGGVRPQSGAWRKSDRTQESATIVIDSTTEGVTEYSILPPDTSVGDTPVTGSEARRDALQDRMYRVSQKTAGMDGWFTQSAVVSMMAGGVSGDTKTTVAEAVNRLIEAGALAQDGPKGRGQFAKPSIRFVREYVDPSTVEIIIPGRE